jgi:integrase
MVNFLLTRGCSKVHGEAASCFPNASHVAEIPLKLNNRTIQRLTPPANKGDVIYFDRELPGFGLRLRRSGDAQVRRTWIVQYRARGRTRRVLIGSAEVLGAEEARAQARKVLGAVAIGRDPQAERAASRQRDGHSLRAVVADYLAVKQPILRPASFRVTKLYLTGKAYFGPLHGLGIGEITRAHVAARLLAITRNSGTVTGSRARSALSTLFAWALGEGLCEANPVVGTNKPPDSTPRDRVLDDSELAAIWNACKDDDYGRVVRLLALTGARRAEIAGMRWSELDLDKGFWSLPKERAKNKRALLLPLPQMALDIIAAVPRMVGRDQLFGQRAASGFTHWSEAKQTLDARLAGKARQWRLHDLRRTCATRMADLGVQPHIIEAVLNHYGGHRAGVAGVYNRSPYEREMKAALALWAEHVRVLVEGGEKKVVPLRA